MTPALYVGRVMHHRLAPARHRFAYRVFSLLLDIDRLAEVSRGLRLFSVNRTNVVSFHERDHGARDGTPLRPWVEAKLADASLDPACGRIMLLSFPRLWGYVFNPISIYFCHDRDDRLAAIVYEVKNTFGGQHPYVFPVGQVSADRALGHDCAKGFYVSPFIEMAARYQFRIMPPAERFALTISARGAEGSRLVAMLSSERRPLTDRSLARATLVDPLMTLKVTVGIHVEALLLWLKGARLQPRPHAHLEEGSSHGDRCQAG